jgi:hypothetical protein
MFEVNTILRRGDIWPAGKNLSHRSEGERSMQLIDFAEKYNLRAKRLEGELVIPGRKAKRIDDRYPIPNPPYPVDCLLGHIFEYSPARMGLVFLPRLPKLWKNLARKLVAAGFEIRQSGDWEGMATFDPTNSAQARLAIKAIGARKKRQVSQAQIKNLARLRTLITSENPPVKPPLAALESIATNQGMGRAGGIVRLPSPPIKPLLASLESIGMAGPI